MPRRARKVQGVPLYMYHEIALTAEEIAALSPEDHARYLEQQSVASTTRQARATRNANTEKAYSRWQREYIHWCEGTAAVGCMVQNDGTLGYPLETTLVGTKCKSLVSGRKLHMFLKDCVLQIGFQAKNRVGYVPGNKKQKKKNQKKNAANAATGSGSGAGGSGSGSGGGSGGGSGSGSGSGNGSGSGIADGSGSGSGNGSGDVSGNGVGSGSASGSGVQFTYEMVDDDGENGTYKKKGHPQFVQLGYRTIKMAVKSVVDLWSLQKDQGLISDQSHPHPRIAPVDAILEQMCTQKQKNDDLTFKDKGINGIVDQYDIADDRKLNVFWWGLPQTGLRNRAHHNCLRAVMQRSQFMRRLKLSDIACKVVNDEGVTECDIAAFTCNKSKTNTEAKREDYAFIRHKDILLCPWNSMAFWFFERYEVNGEQPPKCDVSCNE